MADPSSSVVFSAVRSASLPSALREASANAVSKAPALPGEARPASEAYPLVGTGGRQDVPSRSIAQHHVSSLRATATMATFFRAGLPRRTCS